MKILVVFIDMLRNDIIDKNNATSKNLSITLENIGGIRYSNCYTEAPDTPRSLATFWSGKTPQYNGCNTRLKYPYFFLKGESSLDVALSKNFKIHVFANPNKLKSGIVPLNFDKIETLSGPGKGALSAFFDTLISQDNESDFIFVDLSDLHFANDDLAHNYLSESKGVKELLSSLQTIEEYRSHLSVDKYLIFSDHGHQYDYERRKSQTVDLLDDNRTNVFLQIWQGEKELTVDNRLTTLSEFGKSITESIGGYEQDISPRPANEVRIEDHENFSVSVGLPIKVYRHITSEYDVTVDYMGNLKTHRGFCDKNSVIERSSGLKDYITEYETYQKYKKMKRVVSTYSNGKRRSSINKLLILKYAFRIFVRMTEKFVEKK